MEDGRRQGMGCQPGPVMIREYEKAFLGPL